ncbi:MAG: hypothetical protein AB1610_01310 [Nitrospirota bacterium]
MKKYLKSGIISLVLIGLLCFSVYAQMGGPGRMGPMGPPENGLAALSPDSKFVYVVYKNTLYQYTAIDLKLKKSAHIDTSSSEMRMPLIGGSIFFSHDSKLIYIMQGKTLLLFDALELNYINKVTFE